MSYRIRFIFDQPSEKDSGWSTGFVNQAADLPIAKARGNVLAGLLLSCVGSQTRLKFIRVSSTLNNRAAVIYKSNLTGTLPAKGSTGDNPDSDVPQTALLLTLRIADLSRRSSIALRGIPDDWTTRGGIFTGAGSGDAINALKQQLTTGTNGWVIRYLTPTRPTQPIKSITAGGIVTLQAGLAIPAAPGNTVILGRVSNLPTRSRRFKALNVSVDQTTFTLFPWPPTNTAAPLVGAASTASVADYTEGAIGDFEADFGTTHKVGRPFKVASGRQRTRRS